LRGRPRASCKGAGPLAAAELELGAGLTPRDGRGVLPGVRDEGPVGASPSCLRSADMEGDDRCWLFGFLNADRAGAANALDSGDPGYADPLKNGLNSLSWFAALGYVKDCGLKALTPGFRGERAGVGR
jgi:hypothetical protein